MDSTVVTSRHGLILTVFSVSVFTSALLLFGVQPMFARLVLPILGGSPSVWSVAMVFFQAMLFVGYLYAHILTRVRRPAFAVGVHLLLVAAAGLTLPLAVAKGWGDPPDTFAALWLLGLFTVSIGLPFFALSANNPLLQAWFARSGHPDGVDPYFFYAASNIGSFLALLSYPALLEPTLTLRSQTLLWTVGFWLLFALIAGCGYLLLRTPLRAELTPDQQQFEPTAAPRPSRFGAWVLLSAIPSGLLVAVTAHISTDVAAMPLLWVVPLSLYLLTWVLVFQRRALIPHRWVMIVQPIAIAGLVALLAFRPLYSLWLTLGGHLLAFFVIAMACHGELARQRPASQHLTTFYVSLSLGGMIGGLFAGLIAPFVFSWIAEYPILIVLAALCRPFPPSSPTIKQTLASWGGILLFALVALAPSFVGWLPPNDDVMFWINVLISTIAVLSILLALFARDPVKFAFVIAVALCMVRLYPEDERHVQTVRSFFGVHKIYDSADGRFRVLQDGTTIHGAQMLKDSGGRPVAGPPEPLTYYTRGAGMGQTITAVRTRKGGPISVAAIGLGTGSLSCHKQPGDDWRFFEIDTSVVAIARDSGRFDFLQSCAPGVPIIIGDARLTMAREPDHRYDLIIVDAFSSDSIPIHLVTREAMALFKSKLAPNGVVLMHVSNRHLELASVVIGIAAANGMKAWVFDSNDDSGDSEYVFDAKVVIAAAREDDIGELAANKDWVRTEPNASQRVWSDDYSNIAGALLRRLD